ncbi:MAG: methionyl-tRNA formyltransferase [Eubacteriales bacterium]|nr:methionyl-tRNA formyltransferase [Lachnospiraceae bacterium]MDD5860664.1 methionyl-tRNA formyltransferase [Eubacteriales bacterium]MCH4064424.1 methionyl-tRNA formyltransferase [Lachnospiraceae bacterium]MCH4102851.1 methionyl-tRNA formyltransferase [Lachnospiraceae bacterium]MCI1308702.1 methionyl-tRNA formyltransferase [Lachnospiraceae bacterium]
MKIVFMGTPDFAVGTLRALARAGYEIPLVITQPDRPRGRKHEIVDGPVKAAAVSLGIPVCQPEKIRKNPELFERLREIKPDMIVVAAFGQIIPENILELPRYGCINVHASLLPAYRGAAPIQHAILDGCDKSGVTIMRMDRGLDTGDMIASREVPITQETTGGSLFDELASVGAQLLVDTIPSIVDGSASYTPQPAESTTAYASMISKEMGHIDWTRSASYIERLVRAMNPWPCAFTETDGRMLKIWKAHVTDNEGNAAAPGEAVLKPDRSGMSVKCGNGMLALDEVQLAGKKKMPVADFLRGVHDDGLLFFG